MRQYFIILSFVTMAFNSCSPRTNDSQTHPEKQVRLITVDPGHFHAALVQKTTYPEVDSVVHVYAPEGNDLELHLGRIHSFNTRSESPTNWKEVVYSGPDFLEQMLNEKKGNVVVLAGNNCNKTEYIQRCVTGGLHVLADKPMAITPEAFEQLNQSFAIAEKNHVQLYDIMTERFEITNILQKELTLLPEVFGQLEKGTPEDPAVVMESVHYFYKQVSGAVLTRPAWFFDTDQEGEGIVDVSTHLVDLVQWACFPGRTLDYNKDIQILTARRWTTDLTLSQFRAITKMNAFPDYLKKDVKDSILAVSSNGEISYTLKGAHVRVGVTWGHKADEGAGDTHFSIVRGTNCNLVIRQGAEQNFKPVLFIEPVEDGNLSEQTVRDAIEKIQARFPGVTVAARGKNWEVVIPESYKEGHEAHFSRVAGKFLEYLKHGAMPEWEVPNMIAKYYTTTKALEIARRNPSTNETK